MAARTEETKGSDDEGKASRLQDLLAHGSLARLAALRASREEGRSWGGALVVGPRRWLRAHWRDRVYLALLAGAAVLIYLPGPDPDFGPWDSASDAEQFLRTLWQVQAAALALSLAIIVFAVQAYRNASGERDGALGRYVRAGWLKEGYEMGIVALLACAAVLLGAGHGGTAGWAGLAATGICLASMVWLPWLLGGALRSTHELMSADRRRRLLQAVSEQVDKDVQTRHAVLILDHLAKTGLIAYNPLVGMRPEPNTTPVTASARGVVADIDLRRLKRLARGLRDGGKITLAVRLQDFTSEQSAVLALPVSATRGQVRLATRIVKIRRSQRPADPLSTALENLHEDALAAIRAGSPARFDALADDYASTLLEFPRAWQRYGHEYSAALVRGLELFPRGRVDVISRQLFANVAEALRGPSEDVLLTASYLPIRVCGEALDFRAEGLMRQMIGLAPAFVAAGWREGGRTGELLVGDAPRNLVQFTRYQLEPRLDRGTIAERVDIGGYVQMVFDRLGEILKLAVDRGEVEYARGVDGDWGTLLEHWEPNVEWWEPNDIPQLEQAVRDGLPNAAEHLAQAREVAPLFGRARELRERRRILRFGLALWAYRQRPRNWREMFSYFAAELGDVAQLAETTAKAVEAEYRDRVPWSDWILSTLQEGRAHAIGATAATVETFVALALRAIGPGKEVPVLAPAEWMAVHLDTATRALDAAAADERNEDLPDVVGRARRLREAIETGATGWREKERLRTIDAELVPDKVDDFRANVRAGLSEARVVPELLRLAGTTTALAQSPAEPPLIQSQLPKGMFTADSRWVGAEMVARDLVDEVDRLELSALVTPMADAPRTALAPEVGHGAKAADFSELLRPHVAAAQRQAPGRLVVLLIPVFWQLREALDLSQPGMRPQPPTDWKLSEPAARRFSGVFEGVPVFDLPQVPREALYLVDISKYVTGDAWAVPAEEAVNVAVPDEDDARARAARDPNKDELGEEEIIRRWRETAIVTVDPGFRLDDERDQSALRAFALPTSLTGEEREARFEPGE